MLAKMALPWLGGTPAVWNTCMVFFQMMLLLGYLYAHWLGQLRSIRRQFLIHVSLLLSAAVVLPVRFSSDVFGTMPVATNPCLWLLGCLLGSAGLPFFAVSANAPLLQKWFSRSLHSSAADPYFLYAASNVGSLVALLGYPLLLEPLLRTGQQASWWTAGFALLIMLVFSCGLALLWQGRSGNHPAFATGPVGALTALERPTVRERLRWCLLAFVPSSLMLGVTTYLTTDIASIPLLWVLPLSLYLLTFVLAFAPGGPNRWKWCFRLLPLGLIALFYVLLSEATQPAWLLIAVHLTVFFFAALLAHSQLASSRPAAVHLTEFYLWISVGGVLGGLFNALVSPVVFTQLAEYPAVLILAASLVPSVGNSSVTTRNRWLGALMPVGLAALTLALGYWILPMNTMARPMRFGLAFGIPLLLCFVTVDRPVRFALALAAVMLSSSILPGTHGRPLRMERNFFGVLKVTVDPIGPYFRLVHGNTIHGRQAMDPARRREALSYYHCTGPLGQVFAAYQGHPARTNVGVIGLGAGSMACYAKSTESWTFYEINPAVAMIAKDARYFTFLKECQAGQLEVLLGDARLRLREAPDGHYGLLVIDAFSSDSIPMHLVTREALALYLSKLAPNGLLAFHISNRLVELEGVLGDLAKDANLVCHAHDEMDSSADELALGKDQSHWLVMSRRREDLGRIARDSRWLPIRGHASGSVWTDDFSNLLGAIKWN